MAYLKFDLAKLEKLNDPGRFETLKPDVMWAAVGSPADVAAIVEIGAGTGLFAEKFLELAPSAIVYAADIEQVMIDWMREHRESVARGRLVPLRSTETSVPLADAIADLVIMINLHHELADARATYREAFRLLGPGGKLMVADWCSGESPKGPPQYVRVEPAEVIDMLGTVGFEDLRSHAGLPYAWLLTARRP